MELTWKKVLLVVAAVILVSIPLNNLFYSFIYDNIKIGNLSYEEYQEKKAEFAEKAVPIQEINQSPETFLDEEVVVKGQVDLSLLQEDRYVIYPLFEREKHIVFTDCQGDEPIGDSAYVSGTFTQMKSDHIMAFDNLTAQERENIETANEAMRDHNYTVPGYMEVNNDTEEIYGIKCDLILPAN